MEKFLVKLVQVEENSEYFLKNENVKLTGKISIEDLLKKGQKIFDDLLAQNKDIDNNQNLSIKHNKGFKL